MKKTCIIFIWGIFLSIITLYSCFAQTSDTALAKRFLELNNSGKYDSARAMFAPQIQPKLSSDMFQYAWKQFNKLYGKFNQVNSFNQAQKDTFEIVNAVCDFEKAEVTFTYTFTPSHYLDGFFRTGVKEKVSRASQSLSNAISIDTPVSVNGGKIYGTLLIPKDKKSYPIVLIIAGSGPTDRNGNSTLGESSNMYLMLADSLAEHGIASFRYDKRYIGQSADFLPSAIANISFDDYVSDAADILRFLKQDPHGTQIIIAGHSEGSLIGMIAAQTTSVDAYISLSGAGEDIGKILEWQLDKQAGINKDSLKYILDQIREGKIVEDIPASLQMYFVPYLQHYLYTEMKYDPANEIKRLHIPVLIVNGTTDLQVNVKQAELLHQAKPDAELAIIPGMNHVLKDAPENRMENLATYNEPGLPLNDTLVQKIVQFINSVPSHNHS